VTDRGQPLAPALGRVGPYEIVDLLGQGGMAAVYLARDSRDGREVAVKVLARMRPSWVQRFSREFDAARRVQHPNVVKVLEAGEADGMAYYSMERIHGRTAARYVHGVHDDEPLPPPPPMERVGPPEPLDPEPLARAVDVSIQLARAVGAIHTVGLVHRDLKPGNVLVTDEDVVKLVDFGVAKWLEESSSFTQVGHVVGSYSYMSPEQITGAQVDHRADLYGMGILLYELLTGAPPFRARRPQEYLWLHCTAQPEPVSRHLTGVPPDLDRLLLRMLEKEPADRPESMRAVETELLRIRDELGGAAAPALPPEPTIDPAAPEEDTKRLSSAELTELRKRVRPADGEPSPGSTAFRAGASSAMLAALVTPKHVGRKAELDGMIQHLRAARKQGVRLVLVEGDEGTGKTKLLETFRGLSWVKGARVAIGRCHADGGPWCAPFHDVLLRLAGPGLARAHYERVLSSDRALLTRFFPMLSPRAGRAGSSLAPQGDEKEDRAALFRALGDVLRRVAEDAPLVVGVEDLQWADPGTATALVSLLRRLAPPHPAGVLLVATHRPLGAGDETEEFRRLMALADELPGVHRLKLSPLSAEEIGQIVESATVDVDIRPETLATIVQAARGGPRFAVEVARTLVEAGGEDGWDLPTSMAAAYARRVASLGKRARDVARTVAVLGGQPPLAVVQSAAGVEEADFAIALGELEGRRVLEVDHRAPGEPVSLTAESLQTALLDSLSRQQSRALHRRAATAWLRLGSPAESAAQAARHFYAAGEGRAAFPHAVEAAHLAGEALDYSAARRWMAKIGDPGAALTAISPEGRYRYQILRFTLAFGDGKLDEAQDAVAEAAASAPGRPERLSAGLAAARLHTRRGDYVSAVRISRRGLREAKEGERLELAVRFALQGARAARRSGDASSALAWLAEADLLLSRADEPGLAVRAAWTRSAVLLESKREEDAEREIHRAIDLAERHRQERAEAGLRTNLAVVFWRRGAVDAAHEESRRALEIFAELGERDQVAVNQCNLAELLVAQGKPDDAAPHADAAWRSFRKLGDSMGVLLSAGSRLLVARARQDVVAAEGVIEAIEEAELGDKPLEYHGVVYWTSRARWHRSRQQKSMAWHCLEQAARLLGPDPPAYRKREINLVRAELMYDRQQYPRAAALADLVAEEAMAEMHGPVEWHARAVAAAAHARAGTGTGPAEVPRQLVRDNLELALTAQWYRAEALAADGREAEANVAYAEGLTEARAAGLLEWIGRFSGE